MDNILVTGAQGQLGSEIQALSEGYEGQFFFTNSKELNICEENDVENFIIKHGISAIINCAAYTAVDAAENEEVKADAVNHLAVKNLAVLAQKHGVKLIHISTDYVFNGENFLPYQEDDQTHPMGVYGATKLAGEEAVKAIAPKNTIIIRTSWVYSSFGNNFVKTMRRLGQDRDQLTVIFDQTGTPTYAGDLARVILEILPQISNSTVETYHYSNEGAISWYDFAHAIMEISNIECKILPIESKDYPVIAKRPHYSVLNKSKIKKDFEINIPYWKDSLKECLKILRENEKC